MANLSTQKALPPKRNFGQKLFDGATKLAGIFIPGSGVYMGNTQKEIAEDSREHSAFLQERRLEHSEELQARREKLEAAQMALAWTKHQENIELQKTLEKDRQAAMKKLAKINHKRILKLQKLSQEHQEKLEKYRAEIQYAILDKNINFQKWKLNQETELQREILILRQQFDWELACYHRETAIQQLEYNQSPIPVALLRSPYQNETLPLRILISPPELNSDNFGQESLGFKIENQLTEELRQFLATYYPFNGKHRQTQLLDGAWQSKKFRGGGGIQLLYEPLKGVPTIVLESEVDAHYLTFRLAYWRGDGSKYQEISILSNFPYREFLYDSARERAKKWQGIREKLLAEGETEETIRMNGREREFNLFILNQEQKYLEKGIKPEDLELYESYKISDKDLRKLHQYLITLHCMAVALVADTHYLSPIDNITPLLPSLLPQLLKQIKEIADSDAWEKELLDNLFSEYSKVYENLESIMPGVIPEFAIQFALSLTSLKDKSYAIKQGKQSVEAWLRLNGIEKFDRKLLHSVIDTNDQKYFELLQEFIEKVGNTKDLTIAKRLLEDWQILNELDVIKDNSQVEIDNTIEEENVTSKKQGQKFSFEIVRVNNSGDVIEREIKTNQQLIFDLDNQVKLEMVYISSGKFLMGSPEIERGSYANERPQHEVILEDFWMAKYPITIEQYRAIIQGNSTNNSFTNITGKVGSISGAVIGNSAWQNTIVTSSVGSSIAKQIARDAQEVRKKVQGYNRNIGFQKVVANNQEISSNSPKHPVTNISYLDAQGFCEKLSAKFDRPFQLPSEAQWEYACRGGTTTKFHYGETLPHTVANYSYTAVGARASSKKPRTTTTVGSYPPNAFGLYDMHGNVAEICQDGWHENYNLAPKDGSAWKSSDNKTILLRGGSWDSTLNNCRSARRLTKHSDNYDLFNDRYGFRCICFT